MKRILLCALCALLCLSLCTGVYAAASFSDISGNRHESAILKAADEGLILGYEDGTFRPNGSVSRAEFCAMVNRAFGITGYSVMTFPDVSVSDWFFADVRDAVTAGYIVGLPDGSFNPGGSITRYECALMLARVAKYSGTSVTLSYLDSSLIPEWAREGVAFAQESGIFSRITAHKFHGDTAMTRAETAEVLTAMLEYLDRMPVYYSLVTADGTGKAVNTHTLYKNEYASLDFLVCGRNLGKNYSGDALTFSVTGAIGIHTLDSSGERMASPGCSNVTVVDDDTLRFTVVLDQADYLPAWLTASVRLPAEGGLADSYRMHSSSIFVRYTSIAEYLAAAENPRILYKAVQTDSGSLERQYLVWNSHEAAQYTVSFAVYHADGTLIPGTQTVCPTAPVQKGERMELDITDYRLENAEDLYGKGAYQAVTVAAESSSSSCLFCPTTLPLNGASYAQLIMGGSAAAGTVQLVTDGIPLSLSDVHLSELAEGAYTCTLTITVLDDAYADVTSSFALSNGPELGVELDATQLLSGSEAALGTLMSAGAQPGGYTLLLRIDIEDARLLQTLYLSGAFLVP